MNKIDHKGPTAYDDDLTLWAAEQAALIRAGKLDRVDLANVAEEIESLARSEERRLERLLELLLVHLLRWEKQTGERSRHWWSTISSYRRALLDVLEDSPSLRSQPAQALPELHARARHKASEQSGVYLHLFPEACPYTIEQILDPDFLPGGL